MRCDGQIYADAGPPPANLESLFPVWNDASTWNLAPLASITRFVFHSTSDTEHRYNVVRHLFAGWLQDDWKVSRRLTLNLGARYDFDTNAHSEKLRFLPWLPGNLPHEKDNLAPRLGMNFRLNDRTVLRGGYGLFFAFSPNDGVQQTIGYLHRFEGQYSNDGRADFTTLRDGYWGWFNAAISSWRPAVRIVRSRRKSTILGGRPLTATRCRLEFSGNLPTISHSRPITFSPAAGARKALLT
ncbi:MAG: hypothetical protein DMG18_12960 [Acidobacteria bacterium]|nr:MAG: hypothetical protein DMG18_12960 [Acidobacteriota bacterium]